MIDFSTLQGLTIPEGVVTQIADASGRVIWAVQSGGKVILEVEKITSDTYAGETTYTGEQFILLDIYPKTNGTVNVTYGGLTKTITDTSGAEEPNAQQVYFGTFNGVTDSVETPASGKLTIEGDYYAFGQAGWATGSKSAVLAPPKSCVVGIENFGEPSLIPRYAFYGCDELTSVSIPSSVECIDSYSFQNCEGLKVVDISDGVKQLCSNLFGGCSGLSSVTIPQSVDSIAKGKYEHNPFYNLNKECIVTVDNRNTAYKIDGNCLVEIGTKTIVSGFNNSSIPSYIEIIKSVSFYGCKELTSITIPSSVKTIEDGAFIECTSLSSVTFEGGSSWRIYDNGDYIATVDTSDPASNVTLLTDTYHLYEWTRVD